MLGGSFSGLPMNLIARFISFGVRHAAKSLVDSRRIGEHGGDVGVEDYDVTAFLELLGVLSPHSLREIVLRSQIGHLVLFRFLHNFFVPV